jgi:hypothetical protein
MYIMYHSDTVHRHIHNRVKLEANGNKHKYYAIILYSIYEITVQE